MRREHHSLWSDAIGSAGDVMVYGHYGRPVLVFPSEQGRCFDFENNGMIDMIAGPIEQGRVKVYCVDSFDAGSWSADHLPLEERAHAHNRYEDWIVSTVVPWVFGDCGGPVEILTTGASMGAYHAANFALKRADLFPAALCMSGVYDVAPLGWGEQGDAAYFNNPMAYVANLGGDHLDWLRSRVSLLLVCGQGQWEDTTGSLDSTRRFAAVLGSKGLRHELDLWGYDVPHDWPSWRAQLAHHLPRFL